MTTPEVKSPCISVCVLNTNDICEGCFRSVREITDWSVMTTDQKQAVMAEVKNRFNALNSIFLK